MNALLRHRDVRCSVLAKFFWTFGVQMQDIIVGWQVYELTHDPLSLGWIGFAKALPFAVGILYGGHVADRHDKRGLMLGCYSALLAITLALLGLTLTGRLRTPAIYFLMVLFGIIKCFLWPASTSFLQSAVPTSLYARAMAMTATAWELGAITGPAIGGFLLALGGPLLAYGVVSVSTALTILMLLGLSKQEAAARAPVTWSEWLSGVRFVMNNQIILATMLLDCLAVMFGGVIAILPMFADRMGVGTTGLGIMRAAPAVGAATMALCLAFGLSIVRQGRALLGAVVLYGLCMIGFALAQSYALGVLFLVISGMADNVSVVIRAGILQAHTPSALRGRVSAVNGFFITSSNEFGAFESGVAARLLGAAHSVVLGGCLTLLTAAATALGAPKLRSLGERPHARDGEPAAQGS